MKPKPLPSQSLLLELLSYDPDTGVLTWNERGVHHFSQSGNRSADAMMRKWNTRYAGKIALSCVTEYGYLRGSLLDGRYLAHRIAWKIVHGEDPDHIDHKNHIRSDNRLLNLSSVTHRENAQNMAMRGANKSGFTGVHWCNTHNKWIAKINTGDKELALGRFDSKRDAVNARKEANLKYGYHSNHGKPQVALGETA